MCVCVCVCVKSLVCSCDYVCAYRNLTVTEEETYNISRYYTGLSHASHAQDGLLRPTIEQRKNGWNPRQGPRRNSGKLRIKTKKEGRV